MEVAHKIMQAGTKKRDGFAKVRRIILSSYVILGKRCLSTQVHLSGSWKNEWSMADMKIKSFLCLCGVVLFLHFWTPVLADEERYILTARDGSVRVVQDYRFTEQHVQFTKEDGTFGFIDREDFVQIENMVGVPQPEPSPGTKLLTKVEQKGGTWFFPGLIAVFIFWIITAIRRRQKKKSIQELKLISPGHLTFSYRGRFLRTSEWTVDVQRAYTEKGVLYFEGYCTKTDKRKTFRADRVDGSVTDMSNGRQAPVEHFFSQQMT